MARALFTLTIGAFAATSIASVTEQDPLKFKEFVRDYNKVNYRFCPSSFRLWLAEQCTPTASLATSHRHPPPSLHPFTLSPKVYSSDQEYVTAMLAFFESVDEIARLSELNPHATFGLNADADVSADVWRKSKTGCVVTVEHQTHSSLPYHHHHHHHPKGGDPYP